MIDFLIGAIIGAISAIAILHFTGRLSAKTDSSLSTLETRIRTMIADALNELKAAADAKEAKAVSDAVTAATAPAVAEAQAADEQAVRDFTAANFPAGQ